MSLACELTAWLQMLTLTLTLTRPDGSTYPARRWEPKRLRHRLFSLAGRLATSGRRTMLHLPRTSRWTTLLVSMITRLRKLPAPAT